MPILQNLSTLYESKDNSLFARMVENLIKHEPRLLKELEETIPISIKKFASIVDQTDEMIDDCSTSHCWEERQQEFQDVLWFILDYLYSVYKFVKAYPPATSNLLHYRGFLSRFVLIYY